MLVCIAHLQQAKEKKRSRTPPKAESAPAKPPPSEPVKPKPAVPEVLGGRTGGVYIPPFKLAQMRKEIDDKSSEAFQRMTWENLRKAINGMRGFFFFGEGEGGTGACLLYPFLFSLGVCVCVCVASAGGTGTVHTQPFLPIKSHI